MSARCEERVKHLVLHAADSYLALVEINATPVR